MTLTQEVEAFQLMHLACVSRPERVLDAILRDAVAGEKLARKRNTAELKRYLTGSVQSLPGGLYPVTIHGEHGPVEYETMRKHPKCKPGRRVAR